MPKYKVTYTFEIEVEAPNESIATISADYALYENDDKPYMLDYLYIWNYLTKREVVELKNDFEKGNT